LVEDVSTKLFSFLKTKGRIFIEQKKKLLTYKTKQKQKQNKKH